MAAWIEGGLARSCFGDRFDTHTDIALTQLICHRNKHVVIGADLSGSMNELAGTGASTRIDRARVTIRRILRTGFQTGDRVTLFFFAECPRTPVVVAKPWAPSIVEELVRLVEADLSRDRGTLLRLAHHKALELLDTHMNDSRTWGAVVLVTDGYEDPPPKGYVSPQYPEYGDLSQVYRQYCGWPSEAEPNPIPDNDVTRAWLQLCETYKERTFIVGPDKSVFNRSIREPCTCTRKSVGGIVEGTVSNQVAPGMRDNVVVEVRTRDSNEIRWSGSLNEDMQFRSDIISPGTYDIVARAGTQEGTRIEITIGKGEITQANLTIESRQWWTWLLELMQLHPALAVFTALAIVGTVVYGLLALRNAVVFRSGRRP
jgi:hypothetical protein